jgi:hypothetical protein
MAMDETTCADVFCLRSCLHGPHQTGPGTAQSVKRLLLQNQEEQPPDGNWRHQRGMAITEEAFLPRIAGVS